MSTTVDFATVVEIDEVYHKFMTGGASKAGWVPAQARTCS